MNRKVTVLGAGLMGHGIAQVAAQVGGYEVSLLDVKQEFLDRGLSMVKGSLMKFVGKGTLTQKQADAVFAKIHPTLNLKEAVSGSDLIIEAASEDPKLKLDLFKNVSDLIEGDRPIREGDVKEDGEGDGALQKRLPGLHRE